MLLGHARVLMAKLCRDHAQRNAAHGKHRSMGVPQDMERRGRGDHGPARRCGERPLLVGRTPGIAVGAQEDPPVRRASRRPLREQVSPFLGEHNVSGATAFSLPQGQRIAVAVKVCAGEVDELGRSERVSSKQLKRLRLWMYADVRRGRV